MISRSETVAAKNLSRFGSKICASANLLLIFLCAGGGVPGINESHYLPKAKHLWDRSFASQDFFLQSHDAHFFSSWLAGGLTMWLPLAAVAWLGRLVSWCLLAFAWGKLCAALEVYPLVIPLALLGWLFGVQYGHWAGEWIVGGFEAKTIAYPFILLGLSSLVVENWKWVWIYMGCAVAWHPVIGVWAGLSAGIVWLAQPDLKHRWFSQLPWLGTAAIIGLLGILPAASGLSGPDIVEKVSAAQVHVYMRLPHHLSPQLFAWQRHVAAATSLSVLTLLTIWWRFSANPSRHRQLTDISLGPGALQLRGLGLLLSCAWVAVGFSLIGLALDWTLTRSRPDLGAKLLRFYWFRWSDIAVPLACSLVFWKLAAPYAPNGDRRGPRVFSLRQHVQIALATLSLLIVAGIQFDRSLKPMVPAADRLVVEAVGRNAIDTDRYVDWLAACQWIEHNTPTDSLWFTPKYQQSFKWHAQRAEVYCWKDVPQDNASVIQWYHRVQRCAPPRDTHGVIQDWSTEQLLDLSREYGFRWVLLDLSYQTVPPALEFMYPTADRGKYVENKSFAVFRIPEGLLLKP